LGSFTVNPLDGSKSHSSNAGRIFELGNSGTTWAVIGNPTAAIYAPPTFGSRSHGPDGVASFQLHLRRHGQ
jgi:hypothetical protein